ncbi:PREDICTED: uncharacterized protein LOC106813334 [Priapulus caudatus]|uniref:Uncharacterized protein LOC106813334 n=1 Tax=Priapulus caudatus TaxID=37621 RepID=A0ABM1EL72_PRICU|nr:PREDICTED: uncharacterized protein LOC106813334 [Priapulus caudatus]
MALRVTGINSGCVRGCTQVVFLAVSVGWIVCYVYRFVLLRGALEHLHMTSHDVYLDLSTVAIWEQVLNALIGIIMFLLIVKALRLFRYNTTLAKFGHIYKAASKELVFYATLFLVLLTAYGQIGVLCFGGAPSGGFRSFPAALGTLLDVVTRNGGVRPLLETSRVVAPIYVGSFVTLVFLLLSAMRDARW